MRAEIYDPANGKGHARLVGRLDGTQIPFVHARSPVLSPSMCVQIEQQGPAETTVNQIGVYAVDGAGLVDPTGGIDSALPLASAVFLDGQPCFYRHRLRQPIRLPAGVRLWRPNVPIKLLGVEGRLVAVRDTVDSSLGWVDIYLRQPVSGAYAVYTAVVNGTDVPDLRESLLSMPSTRVTTLADIRLAATTDPAAAIEALTPTRTRVYLPIRPIADTRPRHAVSWKLQVMLGYQVVSTTAIQTASVLPIEQMTEAECAPDGWQTVLADPLTLTGPLGTGQYLRISCDDVTVEADCHPFGTSAVRLRWRSGLTPLDLPDQFTLTGGFFVPKVAIGATDGNLPFVTVSGRSLQDPWHIQVRLGRLTKVVAGVTYRYALPEYVRDLFAPIPPYSRQEELPIRLDEHRFRVRRTPIDMGVSVMAEVRGASTIALTVVDVDPEYGLIQLREAVPEGAMLVITYANRKDYVTYRGGDHYLDLNPRHLSVQLDGYDWKVQSGRRLVGRALKLYWLPYARVEAGVDVPLRQETLLHSHGTTDVPGATLLATLTPTIPFGPASIRQRDARRRGGGLPPNYALSGAQAEAAASFADIGTYDGTLLPLAGSYVIETAPWSGVGDPGRVRQVAEAVGPFGQLPLVRSVPWPESIVLGPEGLWVDLVEVTP